MSDRPIPAQLVRYAVCEAMGSAVPEGFRPHPPARPTGAAGTDVAEGVAVDGVAADPAVRDTDSAPPDSDRVEHQESVILPLRSELPAVAGYHISGENFYAHLAIKAEQERRGRLSRWQETRG